MEDGGKSLELESSRHKEDRRKCGLSTVTAYPQDHSWTLEERANMTEV